MESSKSPAVTLVSSSGKSTTPAKILPEESEDISAWRKMFENFF